MKTGELVELKTKGEVYRGVLMPSKKDFVLKLDSGYNIGVLKKDVVSSKILKKSAGAKKAKKSKIASNPSLKNVSVLHTGGTVASKVSYETGGVISRFSPEELLEMFPEIKNIVNVQTRLVRNMFSEDMNFNHYNLLAKAVAEEIKKGADGIIITHGTDTLHYTSCALSFALEGVGIPVILVGAQRSSDRGSSDAGFNLIKACQFIAGTDFKGVAICMHAKSSDDSAEIILGVNARKLHTSRRDAFVSVNKKPIAFVGNEIIYCSDYNKEGGELILKLFNPKLKVALLKYYPGINADALKCFEKYDGIALEGTGLGHFNINKIDEFTHEKIFNVLKKMKMPIVMSSQCIFGRVNMNIYDTGRKLIDIGVLGNYSDMTPECSFIKLAWLLSNEKERVSDLISVNLRGEISLRSEYEEEIV